MKRLMTLMMVMVVMVVSVSTVEARHPWDNQSYYGSTSDYGYGGGYYGGGNYGGGYYGGGYYDDSDAGKMIAAGRLILDISRAVSSYESTHRTLDMGERAQREEYRNRRSAQSAGTIYGVPITRTETHKVVIVVETPKEKIQQTPSENQKLQSKIEELVKERNELQERQKLQKILNDLRKDIQKLESSADPNST